MRTLERTEIDPVVTPRRTLAGVVALLALVAVACAAWLFELPPAPAGKDAPAVEFSATRAWPHLRKLAGGGPTPIGSRGGALNRDYLVAQLTALGLKPEVQTAVGARSFGSDIVAGLAENVIATIPGSAPTGRVVLAAHYDSTPTTPGTTDDKASVAAILEIVRALKGERLRNDLVILLSDGEEPGLIGAEAFAAHHPLAKGGGVVINLEGPGNGAPSAVYNVTPGGAGLVPVFAGTPHPVGESALAGIYRQTGFHSDLTTLEEHGFIGVDLGTAGGRAYYHHPRDTVDAFDPAVLQMHGENALSLVRSAAQADLPSLRSTADDTYFAAFGVVFRYPGTLVWPLAVLGLLAVAVLAVLARVRRAATVPGMLLSALAGIVPTVVAYGAGLGLWQALLTVEPGYGGLSFGEPYRPDLYRLALVAAAVAIVWAWYALLRERLGRVALAVGALTWLAGLGLLLAWLLPGMSYYGALPALAGGLAGIAALLLGDRRPHLALAVQTVAAAVGVVVLTVATRSMAAVTGIAMAAVLAVFLALAALCALPVLAAATPESSRTVSGPRVARLRAAGGPVGSGVLAVALVAGGLVVDRFDEAHPRGSHLAYVLDAATGTAVWATSNADPEPWTAAFTPDPPRDWRLPLPYGRVPARTGPAAAMPLPAPELTVLGVRQEGGATVTRVRVRSLRQAYQLNLHADRNATAGAIQVAGRPGVPLPKQAARDGAWPFEVQFFAPPGTGVEFELRTEGRPRLLAGDITLGLGGVPGFRPRPAGLDLAASTGGLPTDSVTVVGSIVAP